MENKIRIKDIARLAGVSVGTVDRVLHNRPRVSPASREKIEKVLAEINYEPNMYASALAYNRQYTFCMMMPQHESEAYWQEIEDGAERAEKFMRDFNIKVEKMFYDRFDYTSFGKLAKQCIKMQPDGVVLVPISEEVTRKFTDKLLEMQIPFVILDSFIPSLQPLSFYGQDPVASGYFAARMLMMTASAEKEIMLMKQAKDEKMVSYQQYNREAGFRKYMSENFPDVKITELTLPPKARKKTHAAALDTFFAQHPDVHHCITFNSKAYIVGEYLLDAKRQDIKIMGYDMVARNAHCLRQGTISFLIAQHAYMQGYACIDTLFNAIVLKKEVEPVNYMPIELLTQENVDFYRRTQL